MKSFFNKIHTPYFKWTDFFLLTMLFSILLIAGGQLLGDILMHVLFGSLQSQMAVFMKMYLAFIGIWILTLAAIAGVKRNRPMLKTLGPSLKNNTVPYLLLGLLIGFLMNGFCILVAWLDKDIALTFDSFQPIPLLFLLAAVFVQSSAEELIGRCYGYYRITRGYRSKHFAIIINSLVFALLHAANPGISATSLVELFVTGILFGYCVLYFDSLWMAFGIHTMWNYTQSIIFGLPNSGIVSIYSIFHLDAANARQSFAYGPAFGIEGTMLSLTLHVLVCIVMAYIGRKINLKPYDPWIELETGTAKESN